MVGRHLVVAVGDDQQRPGVVHPPPQEHQQVQSRLVRPVGVLDHHHPRAPRLVQLIQERGEQPLPRRPRRQQLGEPAGRLPGDVVQWAQRAWREQRIAGSHQEPCIGRMLLGKPPDQGRLADAGLARHQGDEAARRRPGEDAVQRRVEPSQFGPPADERPRRERGGRRAKLGWRAQVGMDQREDVLGSSQSLEAVVPDVGQVGPWWQLVSHEFGGPLREQDVTAVCQRPQPRRAVQRLAVVVAAAELRLPAVQRDSGGERDVVGPSLRGQRLLEGERGGDRVGGSNECREGRVALAAGLDELAAVGGHRLGDQRLMSSQGRAHGRPVGLPQ
jgi:hypothetical protein